MILETTSGDIRVKLYNDTPNTRDNFLKNVRDGVYDGVYFHRIIRNFVIQTGDPDTRPGYEQDSNKVWPTIPQEQVYPKHFHKKGALAMAKDKHEVNPKDESHAYQFYIVTGKVCGDASLDEYENAMWMSKVEVLFEEKKQKHFAKIDSLRKLHDKYAMSDYLEELLDEAKDEIPRFTYSQAQRRAYKSRGGVPWLDTEHTVFGEVVEGMKVVSDIEKTRTDAKNNPLTEVRILKAYVVE